MKLSYYDAFDIISEDAGKLLASLESQAVNADKYSSKITREEVLKKVRKPKSVSGKRIRLRLLIAAILILSLSGVAFAASHYDLFRDGAALITDENRDLVGKEMEMTASVYDKDGNLVSGPGLAPEPSLEEVIGDSGIITGAEDHGDLCMIPHSISYFPVDERTFPDTTPEVIFDNGAMIVFTKEDGSGWHLRKGDTLIFETREYHSEINLAQPDKGQSVQFRYVLDHTLMTESTTSAGNLKLRYELRADQDGEYYICIVGCSSDPISLMEGKIYVER